MLLGYPTRFQGIQGKKTPKKGGGDLEKKIRKRIRGEQRGGDVSGGG